MNENRVIPLAFVTDDPTTPLDVTNFAQPLISTPQGAQWVSSTDPAAGTPDTHGNTDVGFQSADGPIVLAAQYGNNVDADTQWIQISAIPMSGDGTLSLTDFIGQGGAAALLLSDSGNVGTQRFVTAINADLLNDAQEQGGFVPPLGVLMVQSYPMGLTGVGDNEYDRLRFATQFNLATLSSKGVPLATAPGEWSIGSAPVANTQATATRAAGGAGVSHVLRSINATLIGVAAIAAPIAVVVRDGATGVGPVLWTDQLFAPAAGSKDRVTLTGLNIIGSDNTAMTIEFIAAPGATNFEAVDATGYDAVT